MKSKDQVIYDHYKQVGSLRATARELGIDRDAVRNAVQRISEIRPEIYPKAGVKPNKVADKKRFVVTCVLNDCDLNRPFLESLLYYCKANKAQLVAIPVRYRNVSLVTGNDTPNWPAELGKFYLTDDLELTSNITIMGSMRLQATASRPLDGLGGISRGKSAVFGHPRVALETIPTPLSKHPLVYMTTGSVSLPAYSDTKAGRLGDFHHSCSAAIVETDGETFYWRHVHANEDGSFNDLDRKYCGGGSEGTTCSAIVPGDIHVDFADGSVTRAVFGDLVSQLKPHSLVLHDVLDAFSISHHHDGKPMVQYQKAVSGQDNCEEEVTRAISFVHGVAETVEKVYLVKSNHHDHLDRWLDRPSNQILPKNLLFWHKLNLERLLDVKNGGTGRSGLEIAFAMGPECDNILFADDKEELDIEGIDCSAHGDRGPNGARGSRRAMSRVQRKTVIGHSHSPGITDGCYQVGMSCIKEMPYVSGYSSWLACCCVIYPGGHRTLLPIINGKYCL